MLITEAVRGEGGRLYVKQDGKKFYFMEVKYPALGNLMPRDVIARGGMAVDQAGHPALSGHERYPQGSKRP